MQTAEPPNVPCLCHLVCVQRNERLNGRTTNWRTMPFTVVEVAEGGTWFVDHEQGPSLEAPSGTVFVVPAQVHHCLRARNPKVMDTVWLYLDLRGADGARLLPEHPFVLSPAKSVVIREIMERVLTSSTDPIDRSLVFQSAAAEIAMHILEKADRFPVDPLRARLQPALQRIEERPDLPVSCQGLAKLCNLSSSRFHALFMTCLGRPPVTFAREVRLRQVCSMLATTADPIETIALKSGFAGAPHVCRHFREKYGMTPAAWRRSLQEERAIGEVNRAKTSGNSAVE